MKVTVLKFLIFQFVILIELTYHDVQSAKILGLFAFPGKSHFMVFKAIMTELAKRRHNVTVISNFKIDEKLNNYNELVLDPPYDYWNDVKKYFQTDDLFDIKDMTTVEIFTMMNLIGLYTTERMLKHHHIQNIIKEQTTDSSEKYDLIIVEQFYQDALLAIGYILKAPIIAISTSSFENHMSSMLGLIVPWSHSPQDFLPYSDKMTFTERLVNTYCSLYSEYNRKFKYFPQQDDLVRKYFSHVSGPIPSVSELEKNVSLILVNNFIPLDIPRPTVMRMIAVGGVHIRPPVTLPRDIRIFLDDAKYGAIYFSLGTNLKSSDLPKDKLLAILNVFKKMKERILWKWEDENIQNLPSNVMIRRWLPQNDILAHPHVRLFITHGGILSLQEAVYRNVPVLGIPIFGDQHINIKKVTDLGIGVHLDFSNLTENSFSWGLQELINNPSYIIEMRKMSRIFRDRQSSALETSMYWIEYVIHYKGALFLKTAAVDLPWYSLYLLDVISFILVCILIIILFFYIFIKITILMIRKRKTNAQDSHSKMNKNL